MKKNQNQQLRFEKDALLRWNLCQKIAKLLNNSKKDIWELECIFDDLNSDITINE